MDNDDKIKKAEVIETGLVEAKKLFLEAESDVFQKDFQQKDGYYLEKELPKLKKNKNQIVWYLVFIFVVAFFLIGFLGVRIIKMQEENIEISIDDFASINLNEIIEKVDNYKSSLKSINTKLRKRNYELEEKIRLIEESKLLELSILKRKNLSSAAYKREAAKIQNKATKEKSIVKSRYQKETVELEEQREQLKEKILVIEEENKANNVVQKDIVTENIKRLTEIKIENIRAEYETLLKNTEIKHSKEKANLQKRFAEIVTTLQLEYEKQIDDYKTGLDRYIDETGNVGIVLNMESDKVAMLYIHPIYQVEKNAKAYVIDRKSKIKAEIMINKKENYFEGTVKKLLNKEEKIAPLDSVVLILQ